MWQIIINCSLLLASALTIVPLASATSCPPYLNFSTERHRPFSDGVYKLSYMRPEPACRTFNSSAVEQTIKRMQQVIKDPDLYRLFENSFPNTLDTTVKWRGYSADNPEEELAFVITGDIDAMWFRDSANQLQSYLSLLKPSSKPNSIASLYRGVINLQARYFLTSPYCQSFQAPIESGIKRVNNSGTDQVTPPYDPLIVWECKYELDSLAAFLEISTHYYEATSDISFFQKFQWTKTVKAMLKLAKTQQYPTYTRNGSVHNSPYTFERSSPYDDTLLNYGLGSPAKGQTGLVRSAFRPSDDPCIYELFIPANMMFSRYLRSAAAIMRRIPGESATAQEMRTMASAIRIAIASRGIVHDPDYGRVYAYEVDGYGSANMMDDANIPSLLSAPVYGFLNASDPVYAATRRKILSADNPYYMRGPVISAVGGPHDGPGFAWPMAKIVSILTSDDDAEIVEDLRQLLSSTDRLGLIHESINTFNASNWTRQWFSWANGLFGQMILDLEQRKPEILGMSFQ